MLLSRTSGMKEINPSTFGMMQPGNNYYGPPNNNFNPYRGNNNNNPYGGNDSNNHLLETIIIIHKE